MKHSSPFTLIIRIFVLAFFVLSVLIPLVSLFTAMVNSDAAVIFTAPNFKRALSATIASSLLSSALGIIIALTLALCLTRTAMPFKTFFAGLFTLPMLVPSISLGMGLVIAFGRNGFVTRILHLGGTIYGLHGIVLGHLIYVVPILTLMFSNALSYQEADSTYAAKVLGIPGWASFLSITIPYLGRTMLSGFFLSFSLCISDYGIPLAVGGKVNTLSTLLYGEVAGKLNFAKGSAIGCLMLIPALIGFIFNRTEGGAAQTGKPSSHFSLTKKPRTDITAVALCVSWAVFILLPFAGFLFLGFVEDYPLNMNFTLAHLGNALQAKGSNALLKSVIISFSASLLGIVVAWFAAYFSARKGGITAKLSHLIATMTMAIPGMVLGIAYILAFKGSALYGGFGIVILVNCTHFFATPYLMLYHTLLDYNRELEPTSTVLNIPTYAIIRAELVPACLPTVCEMFSYFFVNSMVTISAVSFVTNSRTRPISLVIAQYSDHLNLEYAAVLSLVVLLVNALIRTFCTHLRSELEKD